MIQKAKPDPTCPCPFLGRPQLGAPLAAISSSAGANLEFMISVTLLRLVTLYAANVSVSLIGCLRNKFMQVTLQGRYNSLFGTQKKRLSCALIFHARMPVRIRLLIFSQLP